MARKKGVNNRLVAGIIGAIVIIAVVVPVLFLVFNVQILSQTESFEVPFDENNEKILAQVEIAVKFGLCLDGSVPTLVVGDPNTAECPNGDMLMINCEDPVFCTDPFDPDAPFQEEPVIPMEEIVEVINEMNEESMDTTIENMTEFSDDPPITQICDQLGIACGTETVEIEAVVTKIDFNGTRFVVTETFVVPQLAFLVEDTSNINFRDGFLELELFLKTEPNRLLEVIDGDFDLTVANQSIFQQPIKLDASGITPEDGRLRLNFLSPTGIPSPVFTFDIENNLNLFPQDSTTPIIMKIDKLDLTRNNVDLFSLIDQTIFSMDIVREAIRIIIQNEQTGELERVFPSDSRFVIHSKQFCVKGRTCATLSGSTNPLVACPTVRDSCVAYTDRPQIGRADVFLNGELFAFDNGGNTDLAVDIDLRRNENYTFTLFFPLSEGELEYGKSQQNKVFECFTPATVTYTNTYRESTQWYTFSGHITRGANYLEVSTVNEGATTCNFP